MSRDTGTVTDLAEHSRRATAVRDLIKIAQLFGWVPTSTQEERESAFHLAMTNFTGFAEHHDVVDSWDRDEAVFAFLADLAQATASFATWAQTRWPDLKGFSR